MKHDQSVNQSFTHNHHQGGRQEGMIEYNDSIL